MCEVKGEWGDMSPAIKIVVPPSKERKFVLGGCQNDPQCQVSFIHPFSRPAYPWGVADKHRQKFNAFL